MSCQTPLCVHPPTRTFFLLISWSWTFFWFCFLRSRQSLSVKHAAFGMNFASWFILHRKDLKCFFDLVGLRFWMASVFVSFGKTPDSGRWWPSQSTWFSKNSHFYIFNARFSPFKFFSSFSTDSSFSVSIPFGTMRVSSKKQKVIFAWLIVCSMAFWSSSSMSAGP